MKRTRILWLLCLGLLLAGLSACGPKDTEDANPPHRPNRTSLPANRRPPARRLQRPKPHLLPSAGRPQRHHIL